MVLVLLQSNLGTAFIEEKCLELMPERVVVDHYQDADGTDGIQQGSYLFFALNRSQNTYRPVGLVAKVHLKHGIDDGWRLILSPGIACEPFGYDKKHEIAHCSSH